MKHLRAILLLPFMVTIAIPTAILWFFGPDTFGLWDSFPVRVVPSVFGGLVILLGLWLLIATIRLFVKVGQGTLAPWNPKQRLVGQGVYRHVRNPMISGVMVVLIGEASLATSLPLFGWFLAFVIANAVYIPWSEEPALVERFGKNYETYRRNVPRWIPRWKPWTGEATKSSDRR